MEPLTATLRTGMRDTAQRLGIADFWCWWTHELRTLVPARLHNALQRWRLRPVVVFGANEAVVWELAPSGDSVAYAQGARIPLQGDANQVTQSGRAVIDALAKHARRSGSAGPQVVIALTPQQVLRKYLTYPTAVETNLAHVLGYDLDRHTPFKSDELYYDAAVVARDPVRNEIKVELVAALKPVVDQLRRQMSAWGAEVSAIVADVPRADAPPISPERLNLLPEAERVARRFGHWQIWIPLVLAIGLSAAALTIPILDKRDEAITLLHQTEAARIQAAGADALRQQLDQSVEDYNYVLSRKYAYPSTLQLLDDVTRLLPDDTWLTTLELKSLPKGKEPARKEILLRGESGNAGRLVTLLEDSHLFEQAAPRSPTTKIQPGPGEIFDVGAQLRPLPMPPSVAIGMPTGAPAAAASSPNSVPNNAAGIVNAAPRAAPANATSAAPATAARTDAPANAAGSASAASTPTVRPSTPTASATPPTRSAPARTAAAPPMPSSAPAQFGPRPPEGWTPGAAQ